MAAVDEDGSSDPFLTINNIQGEPLKTITIKDSVNPLFYTVKDLLYEFDDIEDAPPIIINVWDEDDGLLDSSPDYMGTAVIYLKDANVHH